MRSVSPFVRASGRGVVGAPSDRVCGARAGDLLPNGRARQRSARCSGHLARSGGRAGGAASGTGSSEAVSSGLIDSTDVSGKRREAVVGRKGDPWNEVPGQRAWRERKKKTVLERKAL